jgi:hypothetical protein
LALRTEHGIQLGQRRKDKARRFGRPFIDRAAEAGLFSVGGCLASSQGQV